MVPPDSYLTQTRRLGDIYQIIMPIGDLEKGYVGFKFPLCISAGFLPMEGTYCCPCVSDDMLCW